MTNKFCIKKCIVNERYENAIIDDDVSGSGGTDVIAFNGRAKFIRYMAGVGASQLSEVEVWFASGNASGNAEIINCLVRRGGSNIRKLTLQNCETIKSHTAHISTHNFTKLTELRLMLCSALSSIIDWSRCERLTTLALVAADIDLVQHVFPLTFERLHTLTIEACKAAHFKQTSFVAFCRRHTKLRSLHLDVQKDLLTNYAAVAASLPQLDQISIGNFDERCFGLAALKQLRTLKIVNNCIGTRVDVARFIVALQSHGTLETLLLPTFYGITERAEFLVALGRLQRLHTLTLFVESAWQLDDCQLMHLHRLTALHDLHLINPIHISGKGVEQLLMQSPMIRTVRIDSEAIIRIGRDDCQRIRNICDEKKIEMEIECWDFLETDDILTELADFIVESESKEIEYRDFDELGYDDEFIEKETKKTMFVRFTLKFHK